MGRDEVLGLLREHTAVLARRCRVAELPLFGSFARGQATGDNDIDLLVMQYRTYPQYPDGGANRQYPSSINPAMCRHVRSSYWRPMICMPTGSPSASPMGATVEGR